MTLPPDSPSLRGQPVPGNRWDQLAQPTHLIPAPGEQLVGIALMAHVEDQLIPGKIKGTMQGDGQFHHAQVGGQMAAVAGYRL